MANVTRCYLHDTAIYTRIEQYAHGTLLSYSGIDKITTFSYIRRSRRRALSIHNFIAQIRRRGRVEEE